MPSLRAFAEALDCRLVVTQPDRPAGRGKRPQPTPVKAAARDLGIAVIEPERLRDALEPLRAIDAGLFAVASYGKIVPQPILDLPRLGALNVHPSLLPLYRGATPLQAQLRDGRTTGGVSIILMDAGMDTGDLVLQEKLVIGPAETYGELHDRAAALGAALLARACAQALDGSLTRTPQSGLADAAQIAATMTRPLTSSDLEIDWQWPARRIVDFIRSLAPSPSARAELCGERVKVLSASELPGRTPAAPGSLVGTGDGMAQVASGDGIVGIARLIPPNRGAMDGSAFAIARAGKRPPS